MVDFPTYAPPLDWTSIKATTDLSSASATYTSLVPIGSGSAPYENYATGVDFVVTIVENAAIGNLTVTFQCSYDNATWFTIPMATWTGVIAAGVPTKFHLPVNSRQWRFVRAGFQAQNSQAGTASTVSVKAALVGIHKPYTTA